MILNLNYGLRKNSRLCRVLWTIRIFVPPKNEGINIILPAVEGELKELFLLYLFSHSSQFPLAKRRLPILRISIDTFNGSSPIGLFVSDSHRA